MARDESTKSKLIKLLQQVSQGSPQRIGLVPSAATPVPAMALVVSLEQADAQSVAHAIGAGADAVVLPAAEVVSRWADLAKAAGEKPAGLVITGDTPPGDEELKRYLDLAPDFIIASAAAAPAALLTAKGIGRIVAVDESYPVQLVRALGEMPIDAVLAEAAPGAAAGPLSVRDLLHYRQVVDLVRRPVLVAGDQRVTTEILPALRDMGIEGILLEVPAAMKPDQVGEHIAAYRKAIDGLGRPIGRARERGPEPIVPRFGPSRVAPAEPEEEPDDE